MCTRVFWNDNPIAKVASRSMDWAVSDEPDLWFYPAGLERVGGPQADAATWTSVYASVALSMWQIGTVDGMNEKGLAAHALFLYDVEPEAEDARATVSLAMWVQYLLDHFDTVADAVEHVADIRIIAPPIRGQYMGAHIAIEDASGDSAIFEPINGEMVVHHGAEFTVMANSPTFDEQLANRARYRPFGGELPPPGDITSADRFVRASYFRHYLPEPRNLEQTVAGVLQVSQNVAVPAGAPYDDGGIYPTWWHSASDLTNLTYYFWSTTSPNVIWAELPELAAQTEVLSMNPRAEHLVGDVTGLLVPAALVY
ncbi:linear amide C-N hydrolase [Subtercola boreus]|uniref:Choloylglycine hydrolase/NAAA C-terminal domain-containing protein n=1 Tax=Subtercola boreus TaxID=120213 RepID=A0A3E0WAZ2_9MICO|nr:linear amide C-N hydrolase [Subtercola boreus]RFA21178.1 hypothetical protein B7R24_07250 [Subtercola boreus]RFA21561.1 hypothetical protein B7R23_07195 [Subtercola boreus]RFA27531.1 hypothetical protein B7R25_07320 [Subtercola boreus]